MTNNKTVYISFYDDINVVKVNKFIQFCTEVCRVHNPSELYFLIASPGGDVDSGFVLYNYLISLQSKVRITMHNTGMINSIANVIFIAGQKRYAAPNAAFLFHGVKSNLNGALSTKELVETLSLMTGMEKRIAETINKHSKMSEPELEDLFRQGQGKDVSFALEKGIIHEIKNPDVPPDAIYLAMTFV